MRTAWTTWSGCAGLAGLHARRVSRLRLAAGHGRRECGGCGRRTSVTAGTVFDRMHTPLTVWFHACWLFATAKDGISAQYLQRTLEIGSYATAWGMLHRLRSVLVPRGGAAVWERRGGRDVHRRGGGRAARWPSAREEGADRHCGGGARAEGIGRCRMAVLADGSAESLHPFITGAVEPAPGSSPTAGMVHRPDGLGYTHERRSQRAARARGDDPGELLPAVHRVASLAKRWLLGTHQGSVEEAHLPAYLNEFAFRFNRRNSRSRGMLFYRVMELAAGHSRSGTPTSSPAGSPAARRQRREAAAPRPAWNAQQRTGPGARPKCSSRFHSG